MLMKDKTVLYLPFIFTSLPTEARNQHSSVETMPPTCWQLNIIQMKFTSKSRGHISILSPESSYQSILAKQNLVAVIP